MSDPFNDGSTSGFVELPVPFAWLAWTRGEAKLAALKDTDPGAFFGGWRAFVSGKDRTSGELHPLPTLPLPVVQRMSDDGKHAYKVYATNVLSFLPIQHRTRFELREKTTDATTGREYNRLVATSKEKRQGYAPCRQIFGWVFGREKDEHAPGLIQINKWSSFIAFNKAGEQWNKIKPPESSALIRRYGSLGITNADGSVTPKFEVYGQGRSTPINAIDLEHPRFFKITDELKQLLADTLPWKNCERWNAEGSAAEDDAPNSDTIMQRFVDACQKFGLSNIEIEQLVKESGGSYEKALKALTGGDQSEEEINSALMATDTE